MIRGSLLDEALALPVEERLRLVQQLWDSVRAEELSPVTDADRALIEERLAAYEVAPDQVRPWEAIKEELDTEPRT